MKKMGLFAVRRALCMCPGVLMVVVVVVVVADGVCALGRDGDVLFQ